MTTFTATPDERRNRLNQLLEQKRGAANAYRQYQLAVRAIHEENSSFIWSQEERDEQKRLKLEWQKADEYYHSYKNHPSNQDLLPLDEPLVEGEPKFGTRPNLPFPRRGH